MGRQLGLTVALCFGLGLGLARAEPVAHASKCNPPASLDLRLDRVDGDADPSAELAFWSRDAIVYENANGVVLVINVDGDSQPLHLERP